MLEPIIIFFDKLIDQFTWRRLVFLTVLLIICSAGMWAFETYTQTFKLARIEHQISLLEKLATISARTELKENAEFQELFVSLTKQLRETDITLPTNYELLPWAKKVLSAAAAWFFFGLFILLIPNTYTRTSPESVSVFAGMTVVASPFIALSVAMPTIPWINYALYPIGHIILLGWFMSWISKKRARI